MSGPIKLTQADARRALVRHHFAPCASQVEVFDRLRSIQFDPIAPVGCNHDLVLQARVPGYKIGDWEKLAYEDRHIYDGWDKQASLVPFEGWPLRRYFYAESIAGRSGKLLASLPEAVAAIISEIERRGPMMPKDFDFQARNDEWKGSWYGPSVTKQVLRALWHTGRIMTAGRRRGQHLYDLTERVVPADIYAQPLPSDEELRQEIAMERHRAMGLLRPQAGYETWSYMMAPERNVAIQALTAAGQIVPVNVDGMKANATPEFLALLDQPSLEPRVVFIAPLDQFMWDRKMIAHVFGFDYVWEIYTPEPKRRWGYYVLPILFGDALVARVEFYCRDGVLELRRWHFEDPEPEPAFLAEFERSLRQFMNYCSATSIRAVGDIDPRIRDLLQA